MDSKMLLAICIAVVASAGASVVPVAPGYDPLPQYSYGYDVQDALTGDYKGHQEQRNGDLVTGSYSVVDPDGTRRIVDYAADPLNGFNAVVRREPLVARVAPVAPAPVIAPAPFLPRAPILAPAPAPFLPRAPILAPAPAPLVAPAPFLPRAPILAPAPYLAQRYNPYYF